MSIGSIDSDLLDTVYFEPSAPKRLLTDLDFVDFGDYFGRFLIQNWGVISAFVYDPPILDRKLGSKEPQNRLKPNSLTVSKCYLNQWIFSQEIPSLSLARKTFSPIGAKTSVGLEVEAKWGRDKKEVEVSVTGSAKLADDGGNWVGANVSTNEKGEATVSVKANYEKETKDHPK